jgi:hypothetical protein
MMHAAADTKLMASASSVRTNVINRLRLSKEVTETLKISARLNLFFGFRWLLAAQAFPKPNVRYPRHFIP